MVPFYPVDRDELTALDILPQPAGSAARALVIASEERLFLAYHLPAEVPASRPVEVSAIDPVLSAGDATDELLDEAVQPHEPTVLLEFRGACVHLFSTLSSQGLAAHPRAAQGLRPDAAYEVRHSSWAQAVSEAEPAERAALRHFILVFAGSIFECLAAGFRVTALDSMDEARAEIQQRLQTRDVARARNLP